MALGAAVRSRSGNGTNLCLHDRAASAIDLRRRPASRPLSTETDATGAIDRSGLVEDEEIDRLIVGLEVRDALDSLSDKHRETPELYYDTDLSQPQISERLGVPLGTIKTRTHHALRLLRGELEEREVVG